MEDISVKRIDHLGLLAGVIRDIGLVELVDELLPGEQKVSTGQGVAAMILNGLGFTDRPLSLTEEFFNEIAVSRLLGEGISHEHLNRHRLGRCLDDVAEYGVSQLFSKIASAIVVKECVSTKSCVLDTTSFSVTGQKYDADENEIVLTHGYSKDHRPDLKQVVSELVVSTDGGIPFILNNHDGNANDSKIFRERSKKLGKALSKSDGRLIADSKLYNEENIENLKKFKFVTRIPETNKAAKAWVQEAVNTPQAWETVDDKHFVQILQINHYELDQQWFIFFSNESLKQSEATLRKKIAAERSLIEKELFHFHAGSFSCQEDIQRAAGALEKRWKYHCIEKVEIRKVERFKEAGRPRKGTVPDLISYGATVSFREDEQEIKDRAHSKACFILGTNDLEVKAEELLKEYKLQGAVERGFRFLKNPSFFTSSFYLKKPSRIDALIGIMTLALMVYAIAERRLRRAIGSSEEPLQDPVYGPTKKPTLRRVMQMLLNINEVCVRIRGVLGVVVSGVNEFRLKIIKMISVSALEIYSINST